MLKAARQVIHYFWSLMMKTISILTALVVAGFALNTAVAATNNNVEKCAAKTQKLLTRFDSNQDGQISVSEMKNVKIGIFNEADQNDDSQLTETELNSMRQMNQQKKIEAKFAALDNNNDGVVTLAEMLSGKKGRRAEARFNQIDSNSDGKVTLTELSAAAAGRSAQRSEKMWARLDSNQDGVVSQAEFIEHNTLFNRVDRDSDGIITAEELKQHGCKKMGAGL